MSLSLPQGAVEGDPVTIPAPRGRGPVRCHVRHHDGEPQEVPVRANGAQFTPDTPGRWWVAFNVQDRTISGCFWVAPKRV